MTQSKIRFASVAVGAALIFSGSHVRAQHDHSHSHDHDHDHGAHGATASTIKIEIDPGAKHAAGKTATTIVRLTGPNGKPVTLDDLKEAHTEKLHLLVVDESLTDYHHEHPVAAENAGEYRFEFTPRHGGTYHVWADLLPNATGVQEYAKTTVKVQGSPAAPSKSTNNTAEVDGYRFDLAVQGGKPLRAGEEASLKVKVTGPDGKPFTALEPVMGAFAHMVAFPTDLKSVMHVHPTGKEPDTPSERGGPDLSFHVVPEQAGYYKFYVQTQIGGRDKFAAFGMEIAPGDGSAAGAADAIYTCPMHPEVRQKGPGKCPKCGGMALVPEKKDADKTDAHDHSH